MSIDKPANTFKLYPDPGDHPDVFIEIGNEAVAIDLDFLAPLTWEDLVGIIFGLKWSYLQNLPLKSPEHHVLAAETAKDLFTRVLDDCRDQKLNCTFDGQGDPIFKPDDIGKWLIDAEILPELIRKPGIRISKKICDLIQEIIYGCVVKPLKTNEAGDVDWMHYASLPKWPRVMALQILREGEPWDWGKVRDAENLSFKEDDCIYQNAVFDYHDSFRFMKFVYPAGFCVWAETNGLPVPTPLINIFEANGKLEKEICRVEKLISSQKEETKKVRVETKKLKEKGEELEKEEKKLLKELETAQALEQNAPELTAEEDQIAVKSEGKDVESFVKSLIFKCENEVEIIIQSPGEMPIVCSPSILGFRNDKTKQWLNFIRLLNSSEGAFSYGENKGQAKRIWGEIEKKLMEFIGKKFDLSFPENFKLFLPVQGFAGKRKTLFQVYKLKTNGDTDFDSLNRDEVCKKIRALAIESKVDTAESLAQAVGRAKELGMSVEEIQNLLITNDLIENETSDLNTKDSLDQDRSDITGKNHGIIHDVDFTEDQ